MYSSKKVWPTFDCTNFGAWNVTGWNWEWCNKKGCVILKCLEASARISDNHDPHLQWSCPQTCKKKNMIPPTSFYNRHLSCPHFCFHATWQSGNHTITIWSTMSIFESDMWDTISMLSFYIYMDLEMHRASNVSPWQESIPGSTWALPKRY